MARNRNRLPITANKRASAAKRALAAQAAMKRALALESADEPVPKKVRLERGGIDRTHEWTEHCHLRCRRRGPPCQPKAIPSVASVALLADNKATEKLGEVQHGRRIEHIMPEDVVHVQDAAVEQSRLVVVFDVAYVAEDGTMTEFTIEGPNVDGQPAGRTIEYLGAIDGTEVVPLYNRRGGPLLVQSTHANGFMLINDDELVPHVGQYVYGRWLESTSGFAAGFYRGVVMVREQ